MKMFAILFFTLWSLVATPALAQLNTNTPQLAIELKPEFPQPGEVVVASLNDYSGGAYGSSIIWSLNGEEVPNSNNQRSITFTAGPDGSYQNLEILLSKPSGGKQVLRASIKPTYLDIIIEPQTRVPSFYLGRSLPSLGSQINATALVGGLSVDSSQYIYTWRINQKVVEGGPLRGGSKVSFLMPIGKSSVLSVAVTDLRGNTVANRAIRIPSIAPEIHFYEVSTLFGVSQKPFNTTVPLIGNTVTVQAEPYYLDSQVFNDPDIKIWKIDGVTSKNNNNNPYQVTLERVGEEGSSRLQFHVRDTKQVLQGVEGDIQINF